MLLKNKKIFYIFLFLICAFAMCIIRYLAMNNCFWGDDFEFSIYSINEHTFDCLIGESRLEHGGYYLGSFLCKFMCFKLPLLLKLHPSDFIINVSLFNGLFFIIISVLAAKFAVFYRKSKTVFWGAFCLFLFYSVFFSVYSGIINTNYAFYRYFFSLLFYCVFWYYIYKHLLYNYEKQNDPALWGVCLCGFVVGTSIEIVFFSSLILAGIIFIYDKVICRFIKTPNDMDFKKSYKLNLNKNFYYPVLYLFIGVLLFTTTHGFLDVSKSRGLGHTDIFDINLIKEFFIVFFKNYVADLWYYWLLFIIFCTVAVICAAKRKDTKKVLLPLFMQNSILLVIFSLIFCGKTHSIDNLNCFFLEHVNIIALFKNISLIPLFILISYVISSSFHYCKSRKKKTIINIAYGSVLFILTAVTISMFFIFPTPGYVQEVSQKIYVRRQAFYIAEKMLRFFYSQNKLPEIPREVCIIHPYFIDYDFDNRGILIENKLSYVYYARLYKDKKVMKKGFKYSDDALKKFYDAGGSFTKEELKNLKFSKLFNKDFVLNKQKNNSETVLNYDEMKQELSKSVEIFEN